MKIVFLDVDGVLNTRPGSLDLEKLSQLKRIVDETGAEIVVSSDWRLVNHQWARLKETMTACNMPIKDTTPNLRWGPGESSPKHRGREILQWLRDNVPSKQTARWLAIDDQQLLGLIQVRTDTTVGLTPNLADQAIGILNYRI